MIHFTIFLSLLAIVGILFRRKKHQDEDD